MDQAGEGWLGLSEEDGYTDIDLPQGAIWRHTEFAEIELQRWVRGRDTNDQSLKEK